MLVTFILTNGINQLGKCWLFNKSAYRESRLFFYNCFVGLPFELHFEESVETGKKYHEYITLNMDEAHRRIDICTGSDSGSGSRIMCNIELKRLISISWRHGLCLDELVELFYILSIFSRRINVIIL